MACSVHTNCISSIEIGIFCKYADLYIKHYPYTMKSLMLSRLLARTFLLLLPGLGWSQNTSQEAPESEPECGGYAPTASFHVVTNVDGLRLRQRPAKDAPVLATLPTNTRLIWHENVSEEVFEATFNDGIPRKGRWVNVTVWKGQGQSGWVFSGALTLRYIQYDAELGGGLECLHSDFANIQRIDSLNFALQFAQSASKRQKMGSDPLGSPDGQYSLRQLNTKQDKMSGLEFTFRHAERSAEKITLEMVYGNHVRSIAWAKDSGKILIEWADEEMGKLYYEMEMPQNRPDIP